MPVSNHQSVIRQYLLGQLTDVEQENVEQRFVVEDDFFEELEVGKDEVVEDYLAGQLSAKEKKWLEEKFLASPEGQKRLRFASVLNRYVLNNRHNSTSRPGWTHRWGGFWTSQPIMARAVGAVLVLAIVGGIFWYLRVPPTRSVAALTLIPTQTTRSGENGSKKVQLKEDALQLTMMLPAPAESGGPYRVELLNTRGVSKIFEASATAGQSLSLEIPASQLPPGRYVMNLSKVRTDGTVERLPGGSYHFTVE